MRYFFFVISIFIVIASCHKSNTSTNVNPAVQVTGFKIKFDNSDHPDSSAYYKFIKDNLGRVTYFMGYYSDSAIGLPTTDTILSIHFWYDGANMLPSIAECDSVSFGLTFQETHYYFYNSNNNLLINDSTVNPYPLVLPNQYHYYSFYYRYENNYMIQSLTNSSSSGPVTLVDSFHIIDGNILWFKLDPIYNMEYTYEYDNGINTLNNLNIAPIFFTLNKERGATSNTWSYWTASSRNNLIGTNGHIHSEFVYDANGIVTKRIFHDQSSNYSDTLYYLY